MKVQKKPVLILCLVLSVSYYLGFTPALISLIYFIASVIAYYLYAKDKKAAQNDTWRVSENTLHVSALIFGWPGAMIAQQRLRHKTKKIRFRVVFWLTFLINVSFLVWVHTPRSNQIMRVSLTDFDDWIVNHNGNKKIVKIILTLTYVKPSKFIKILPKIDPSKEK